MLAGWQPRFGASPHPFLQWSGNLSTISQASQTPVTLGKVPPPPQLGHWLLRDPMATQMDGWMFLPGSWQLSSSFGLVAAHCPHPVLSVAHAPQAPWT